MNILRTGLGTCLALAMAGAVAAPVEYRLETVTDGQIGARAFSRAAVTIVLVTDTRDVQTATVNGATVYTVQNGQATIRVSDESGVLTARIAPGQIYARYDITNGILGFGSRVSPFYPIALGCGNASCSEGSVQAQGGPGVYNTCCYFEDGLLPMLVDLAAVPSDKLYVSPRVLWEHETLSFPTLLTGVVQACAVPYTNGMYQGQYSCNAAATVPLHTDHGDLYIQDQASANDTAFFKATVFRPVLTR